MKLLCVLLLAAVSLRAADGSIQQVIEQGNDAFYNLDFEQSIADYEKAIAAQPENAQFHNHLAHALLYREMFRDGALESELVSGNNSFIRRPKLEPPPDVEKRFFAEIERSMQLSQAAGRPQSAGYAGAAYPERGPGSARQLRLSGAQELAGVALRFQPGAQV